MLLIGNRKCTRTIVTVSSARLNVSGKDNDETDACLCDRLCYEHFSFSFGRTKFGGKTINDDDIRSRFVF